MSNEAEAGVVTVAGGFKAGDALGRFFGAADAAESSEETEI